MEKEKNGREVREKLAYLFIMKPNSILVVICCYLEEID